MGSLISLMVMSSSIQFVALVTVSIVFALLTPFTKVEESFNVQATHDFIFIGFPRAYASFYKEWHSLVDDKPESEVMNFILSSLREIPFPNASNNTNHSRWDHEDFTGAVPRTFIGSFALALLTLPWTFVPFLLSEKLYLQVIARVNLAIFTVIGFNSFANAIGRKYGTTTRRMLVVITLVQFHFLYYVSRPLPNTFALGLTLFALSAWVVRNFRRFIILTAFTVVVFRSDTSLLFGWIILFELLITEELDLWTLLKIGIPAGLLSLSATILFDSFMWGRWLWPEGEILYFNVYMNKSHEWGTSPFLWYFYSALPRSLEFSLAFVPFATKKCMKNFFLLPMMFISCYSCLAHKELRFIIYAIPMLNVCAASTMAIIFEKFEGTKPCSESYVGNMILGVFGQKVPSEEEAEAADKEREKKEQEEEEARLKKLEKKDPPAQYDAIIPAGGSGPGMNLRRRGKQTISRNGMEAQLDEQYSKITAAVLEKHGVQSTSELIRSPSFDEADEDVASISVTFLAVFILIGVHLWCNFGLTVYASVAAWNNYPGGDAIYLLNQQIRNSDLKDVKPEQIGVYVSNLAAQTGFTRFTQIDGVEYDKSPFFSLVANRTVKGSRIVHDFSNKKIVYPILEKVDVPFLQQFCTATASKGKKSHAGYENVICSFGENARNCKILRSISGFSGIDFGLKELEARNPISLIKTTPVLWIFRCVK